MPITDDGIAAVTAGRSQGLLGRERIVAGPGFNRWLVPPAALAIHLCIGMAYGFSVFWLPLSRAIGIQQPSACPDLTLLQALTTTSCDWRVSDLVWVYTLFFVLLGASAALFGGWLERAGPRKAGVVSALCWCGGMTISALGIALHQLWLMWLGSGVIGGIGLGLGYISPVSTLIKWFPDRRGMATGMAIMGFGGGAMIGSPLADMLMNAYRTPASVGVWQSFLMLAAIYFVFMMAGALGYRVPPAGWRPQGWTPPASKTTIAGGHVHLRDAHRTPQFWLLWAVLCLNVSASIGIIGVAAPMLQEVFGGWLIGQPDVGFLQFDDEQKRAAATIAAGFVGLISLFNIGGRFFWASLSDKLGRKATYVMFFVLGAALYIAVPSLAAAHALALYVLAFCVIASMYGGGFATIPAYLADVFGTQFVGAIHGRLLTAWSTAGIVGPLIVAYMRDAGIAAGVSRPHLYDRITLVLAALLAVGFVANLLVRPLATRWFTKDAEPGRPTRHRGLRQRQPMVRPALAAAGSMQPRCWSGSRSAFPSPGACGSRCRRLSHSSADQNHSAEKPIESAFSRRRRRVFRGFSTRQHDSCYMTPPFHLASTRTRPLPAEPKSSFLREIVARGFLHQCTDLAALDERASRKIVTAYIGFDATADSLHVGSLVQIMMLRLLQRTGHRPIVLMGGGTTKVGDPSGRDESRKLLSDADINSNIAGIKRIFAQFLTFGDGPTDAVMVNNADWLDGLQYIPFLRDYGRHFSVNRMLAFDSVKLRLEREQPLSFLEFNYMILQAYDFLELARRHDCVVQMGGSDQWGNIVNGVELGRRVDDRVLYGLTTPLITTASGAKMGKTATGAVWLNADRLSPYDYWQYFRNTEDADVGRFLRLFTDLPIDEIERLEKLQGAAINEAKIVLANETTALAHGADAAAAAAETARRTFVEGDVGEALPTLVAPRDELQRGIPAFELFRRAGLAASNGEARRLIKGGGARLNDQTIEDETRAVTLADVTTAGHVKLSAGKKRHALVRPE